MAQPQVVEEVPVAPTPGPGRPISGRVTFDPTREMLPAERAWLNRFTFQVRTLPSPLDDLERAYPLIYDKMELDPQVGSAIDTEVLLTLSQPLDVQAASEDDDPSFDDEIAEQMARFCRRNLARLGRSFESILADMAETGYVFGHSFAEVVWATGVLDPRDGPQLLLKDVKVKPNKSYIILSDPYRNFLGLLPAGYPITPRTTFAEVKDDLIPPTKLVKFINRMRHNDWRGRSELRRAYPDWWMTKQLEPEWLSYMTQFAVPSMTYTQGPDTPEFYQDPEDETKKIRSASVALAALKEFRNSYALVLPNGEEVKPVQVTGNGEVFPETFRFLGQRTTKTMTGQSLATDESQYQPRASTGIHRDMLLLKPRFNKGELAFAVMAGIFAPLIAYNYGPEYTRYVPDAQLGEVERWDFGTVGNTITQMAANFLIPPSIVNRMFVQAGMPRWSREDLAAYKQGWLLRQGLGPDGAPKPPPPAPSLTTGGGNNALQKP